MNMNKMFDPNQVMQRMFKRAENIVWDLQTGNLGVETKDGLATFTGTSPDDSQINIGIINFTMPIPAFAQNTPLDQVKFGDMIYTGGDNIGWVIEKKEKAIVLMRPNGTTGRWTPPNVQMVGNGVMVVRSLINMLPGGASGVNNLQNTLLPLMMMSGQGGEDFDFEGIMPMILMTQMGALGGADPATGAANPFGAGFLQQMLMMKMMSSSSMFGAGKGDGKLRFNK